MSTLVLPDPSLVVLIGAAGSGKSTLASRLFAPGQILSSDALRAAVSGNAADQAASAAAFHLLYGSLDRRLAEGQTTIVDATNARLQDRRRLLQRAQAAGIPVVAIVLDLRPSQVHAQNAARTERVVGRAVVDRHLAAVRQAVDTGRIFIEPFDHVVLLRSPADVVGLRVQTRTPDDVPDGDGRPAHASRPRRWTEVEGAASARDTRRPRRKIRSPGG